MTDDGDDERRPGDGKVDPAAWLDLLLAEADRRVTGVGFLPNDDVKAAASRLRRLGDGDLTRELLKARRLLSPKALDGVRTTDDVERWCWWHYFVADRRQQRAGLRPRRGATTVPARRFAGLPRAKAAAGMGGPRSWWQWRAWVPSEGRLTVGEVGRLMLDELGQLDGHRWCSGRNAAGGPPAFNSVDAAMLATGDPEAVGAAAERLVRFGTWHRAVTLPDLPPTDPEDDAAFRWLNDVRGVVGPVFALCLDAAERWGLDPAADLPRRRAVRTLLASLRCPATHTPAAFDWLDDLQAEAALRVAAERGRAAAGDPASTGRRERPAAEAPTPAVAAEAGPPLPPARRDSAPGGTRADGPGPGGVFRRGGRAVTLPPKPHAVAAHLWNADGRRADVADVDAAVWGDADDHAVTRARRDERVKTAVKRANNGTAERPGGLSDLGITIGRDGGELVMDVADVPAEPAAPPRAAAEGEERRRAG